MLEKQMSPTPGDVHYVINKALKLAIKNKNIDAARALNYLKKSAFIEIPKTLSRYCIRVISQCLLNKRLTSHVEVNQENSACGSSERVLASRKSGSGGEIPSPHNENRVQLTYEQVNLAVNQLNLPAQLQEQIKAYGFYYVDIKPSLCNALQVAIEKRKFDKALNWLSIDQEIDIPTATQMQLDDAMENKINGALLELEGEAIIKEKLTDAKRLKELGAKLSPDSQLKLNKSQEAKIKNNEARKALQLHNMGARYPSKIQPELNSFLRASIAKNDLSSALFLVVVGAEITPDIQVELNQAQETTISKIIELYKARQTAKCNIETTQENLPDQFHAQMKKALKLKRLGAKLNSGIPPELNRILKELITSKTCDLVGCLKELGAEFPEPFSEEIKTTLSENLLEAITEAKTAKTVQNIKVFFRINDSISYGAEITPHIQLQLDNILQEFIPNIWENIDFNIQIKVIVAVGSLIKSGTKLTAESLKIIEEKSQAENCKRK